MRGRLVDLLGPHQRRPQSQSASGSIPEDRALSAAARWQEAGAAEQQLAARDVAHGGEPRTAAQPDQNRIGRRPGTNGEGRNHARIGVVVYFAPGRPRAVLWTN